MWLALTLLARLAAPAPEPAPAFELHWSAPSECPDHATVRAAVERRLGRALAPPLGDGLVIDVRAEPQTDARWRIVLDLHGPDGDAHRELGEATDCAAAVEAAALVIAIGIDPELVAAVPEAPAPAEPEPTTPTSAATTNVTTDARDDANEATTAPGRADVLTPPVTLPDSRSRTRAAIGATAAVSLGDVPTVGGHGRFVVALLRPRVRVELGGSYGAAPPFEREGVRLELARWTVDARACGVIAPRPWLEVLPCAGVEAGQDLARPRRGVLDDRRRRYPWAAAIAAPTLAFVPRRWLALRLGLELRVPFTPRQYTATDPSERARNVYRTARVSGALVAGIELRFP